MPAVENTNGTAADVDATLKALRTTIRPPEALAWLSVGAQSGNVTGVAVNAALFSFRNLAANPIMVRRIGIGFVTTTAFTTAQMMSFGLMSARAFTVSDSAGTAIALTGSNAKHRTALGTLSSVDCRMAAAGALTAGTKTLDANHLSQIAFWSGAQGAALAPAPNNLFGHDPEDYPLILAQNEGFNIMNLTAMGAAGVGVFFVNIEVAECTAF